MQPAYNMQCIEFRLTFYALSIRINQAYDASEILITLKQNIMAEEESDKKWTHERKLLLLNKRLSNEVDFCAKRKKKSVLWEKVLREIKGVDAEFPFSWDDITRKFK
ncbi:PREDICTED: uncharacterized protein LOC108972980 [Bactrocera latifrons]|uniref:uncharacterized protein LOC108972980 n=1 Tax=Bactrocera latifrons TaxID=174628 RepID=UPI0008DD7946|nr:PREDICTED: uncharacterized protein LOC108972980 [Bactrocera latifrons]